MISINSVVTDFLMRKMSHKQKNSVDFHQSFIDKSIKYLEHEAKKNSFNNIVPSKDMSSEEYQCFLEHAKAYEMQLDVVSQETYYKICKDLWSPIPKPIPPAARIFF